MYSEYIEYLKSLNYENFKECDFKSNNKYKNILEHVSYELGLKYLELVHLDFPSITYETIQGFININDKYGFPDKEKYMYKNNIYVCSPTTLRYIYHALVILNYYKNTDCKNIVEVGCGYGGLYLAINYFSNKLGVIINNYNIIDLPETCILIENYLNLHNDCKYSTIQIHTSNTYGEKIKDDKLFFISNYCFTEIDETHNKLYSGILLTKTTNGFIIWQNGGNNGSYRIEQAKSITGKEIVKVIEEKPQTDSGYSIHKNYFVYF
jgi:hypothetical protein